MVALAMGRLVAEARGGAIPNAFLGVMYLASAVSASGVSEAVTPVGRYLC